LKANVVLDKGTTTNTNKEAESSKLDISSIIEAKVGKLVEAKLSELLGT
jgi:hypothetical protein